MRNAQGNRGWAAVPVVAILTMQAAAIAAPAQQDFHTLVEFNLTNGGNPYAALVQGLDGNFYGTSYADNGSFGTVFKITPTGALTTLYNFCQQGWPTCSDGEAPYSALVETEDGDFYGTTYLGGASQAGTVFSISPSGALTTLHTFTGTDGGNPYAGLVLGTDGNLYGTTTSDGANGGGTIFKMTPAGVLTTLYNFCAQANCTDGNDPIAGLIQGSDGNFYGTTEYGGAHPN
jgi:uncharacterized repeat protein (TIGR03803 family)